MIVSDDAVIVKRGRNEISDVRFYCEHFFFIKFQRVCMQAHEGIVKFLIAPKPGGTLTSAQMQYQSIYGSVSCGWTKTEQDFAYRIKVPSNCTADIVLPDGRHETVTAGEYVY